jgi:hypothetical protein
LPSSRASSGRAGSTRDASRTAGVVRGGANCVRRGRRESRPRGDDGESGAGDDRGVFTALLAQPWEHGGGVDAGSVPRVGGRRDRGQGRSWRRVVIPDLVPFMSQLGDGFGGADTRTDLLLHATTSACRGSRAYRTAVAAPRLTTS